MSKGVKIELKRVILKPFAKDRFELVSDYEVLLCIKDKKQNIFSNHPSGFFCVQIKAGFKTNGVDIPRLFWSIYPPNNPEYLTAVVIHDYLCELASSRIGYKIADLALKEALRRLGVSEFKTWVFFNACNLYHTIKFIFKKEKK